MFIGIITRQSSNAYWHLNCWILENKQKMSIVLPFAEKFVVEEVSGDMLFPRGFATTGTCTYSGKSSRFYLGVMEPSVRIQTGFEDIPES